MNLPYSKIKFIIAAGLLLLVFPAVGEVFEKRKNDSITQT